MRFGPKIAKSGWPYWFKAIWLYRNDDAFESVSQGVPDSYVHSSGFLDRSCDRYELDPSNMYGSQVMLMLVLISYPSFKVKKLMKCTQGYLKEKVQSVWHMDRHAEFVSEL